MKTKSSSNQLTNAKDLMNAENQKSSLWKLLCPCFSSKKQVSQKSQKHKDSYLRDVFQEQNTNIEQNMHEETQDNLPINFQVSEFQVQNQNNGQNGKTNGKILKQVIQKSPNSNGIKFNIKRNSNLGQYLNQKKNVDSMNSGKQNNKPNIGLQSKQRFQTQMPQRKLSVDGQLQGKKSKGKQIIERLNNNKMKINRQQLISIDKQLQKMQGLADYEFLQNWQQTYENNYPINSLEQNKLIVIGTKTNKLLTKITSVKLFPSPSSVERYKESIKNKQLSQKYGRKDIEFNSQLDRYWDKRYFLFQRFDQGINLDEESWYSVTPEAVADYISSKINVKNTILDAFCGAGGDSLKLATSCANLIANDIDQVKLKCLSNNAKIYDISNITISCEDFFKVNNKVDAVYLAPPWGGPDYYKIQSFHPDQFEPKLSAVIEKAFNLSSNIFFLLPANTDVEALASIISQKISKVKHFKPQSCALKIQKIYFNERIKFIGGFFGNSQVQNDIKLSEELSFIYELLRDDNETIFKHKKLIRKLREEYGMINLLNFVFESQNYGQQPLAEQKNWNGQQPSMIQRFQKLLIMRKLIDQKTLQKIKEEQQIEYEHELKYRQQKNKRQKNKKIQKLKEKQQRQQSLQNTVKVNTVYQKEQCPQQQFDSQYVDIPISDIIKQAHKKNNGPFNGKQTIQSNIDIHSGIEDSQRVPARDSLRTVSLVSQFHEDQLRNIGNCERFTTNSDISIKDSIHPIQKYDELEISIDASLRISQQSGNLYSLSGSKKQPQTLKQQFKQRHSSPALLSARQPIKMNKVKEGPVWQKGIVEQANEQKDT